MMTPPKESVDPHAQPLQRLRAYPAKEARAALILFGDVEQARIYLERQKQEREAEQARVREQAEVYRQWRAYLAQTKAAYLAWQRQKERDVCEKAAREKTAVAALRARCSALVAWGRANPLTPADHALYAHIEGRCEYVPYGEVSP